MALPDIEIVLREAALKSSDYYRGLLSVLITYLKIAENQHIHRAAEFLAGLPALRAEVLSAIVSAFGVGLDPRPIPAELMPMIERGTVGTDEERKFSEHLLKRQREYEQYKASGKTIKVRTGEVKRGRPVRKNWDTPEKPKEES